MRSEIGSQIYGVINGNKSIGDVMRERRFIILNNIISNIIKKSGSCSILDIGGTEKYWNLDSEFVANNADKLIITVTNIDETSVKSENSSIFNYKVGDATEGDVYEGNYNFIHSNSVIEHVGNWSKIRAMASNVVARKIPYYIQTPNYWFPVEPHFRSIGFHWLPLDTRAKLLLKKQRGFRSASNYEEAMESVNSINLLTVFQMRQLFPNAEIVRERVGPFTKSIIAIGGTQY
jgi:hypothetical protein